jgi:type II secretory pathway component PulF
MAIEMTCSPLLAQIFSPDDSFNFLKALIFVFVWLGLILGAISLIHFLFSLPMRRAERARLFLDLVEDALKRGQSIEEMMLFVVRSRDHTVGIRFHILAAYIENGLQFIDALKKVPRFLPPQISEMLQAGQKIGDVRRILPACREVLRDNPAGVRSAVHYMLLVVLLFSPVFIYVVIFTVVFVFPRFQDVALGMNVPLWPESKFVFGHAGWLIGFEVAIFFLLVIVTVAYLGGPGFSRFLKNNGLPFVDRMAWNIPWKRKRLQRTFSAMLAVLLDAGVPEPEAVRIAGDCTANEICRKRTARILAALQQGVKLDEAVRVFDDNREFHWRLANAAHARGGFLNALQGWHETLDAKAFQEEEATAHSVTTLIVILNGVLVGLIATAMFGLLVVVVRGGLYL